LIFIQPITSCSVPHGEVARFHACVSGMPKPEISWFHNRQPVQPTKNVVFHFDEVSNTATLIIVDAFSEHAGQYTCRAANNAGEAACSATLIVTEEEEANRCSSRTSSITSWAENIKPSFTKKLKFQSVMEGEPVELKCKLVACPPPTILWFHNNKPIPKERRRRICTDSKMHIHVTSLVIDSIKEKDSGSYKVMAINTEGSAESTASLLVSLREEHAPHPLPPCLTGLSALMTDSVISTVTGALVEGSVTNLVTGAVTDTARGSATLRLSNKRKGSLSLPCPPLNLRSSLPLSLMSSISIDPLIWGRLIGRFLVKLQAGRVV
uniref:Ig-like domain-containing protein n=1 Tax=Dicentrarchus labrax TaxID=13489 RepID=A0A8C4IEV5_DICLA